MSLPAYLFLYDENGVLIKGSCSASGREGAIEVMSTQHNMNLSVDAHSGMLTGRRMHQPVIINKEIDCTSPYLADLLCTETKASKAILRFYSIIEAGIEVEFYNITLEKVIISSISVNHAYIPGSTSPNMMETVSLRYGGISWNYLRGNIIKNDFWGKENQK
ncbi:Hcp family type VI secretion system effector [Chimaeribacter arupi]|uniref:Hcp family type VI secretion system effector n=1 Tax=Chimaeribacter arupi TaxID=2060066 RepID=UPI000C7C7A8B|nr:type VI secretion system tube protein Hcp [Chimaeribacter arupi]PLR35690.1 type VI secretion system tube protein Hcp [Chimaeribacter arupi]